MANSMKFPTALDSHKKFALSLATNVGDVRGDTVPMFLMHVLELIDKNGVLSSLEIPFSTSGSNYMLNYEPNHASGKPFTSKTEYESKKGSIIFINVNHPRFFALRQGARMLASVGLMDL